MERVEIGAMDRISLSSAQRMVAAVKALDSCCANRISDDMKETVGKLRTVLVKLLEYHRWHMAENYEITEW